MELTGIYRLWIYSFHQFENACILFLWVPWWPHLVSPLETSVTHLSGRVWQSHSCHALLPLCLVLCVLRGDVSTAPSLISRGVCSPGLALAPSPSDHLLLSICCSHVKSVDSTPCVSRVSACLVHSSLRLLVHMGYGDTGLPSPTSSVVGVISMSVSVGSFFFSVWTVSPCFLHAQ